MIVYALSAVDCPAGIPCRVVCDCKLAGWFYPFEDSIAVTSVSGMSNWLAMSLVV